MSSGCFQEMKQGSEQGRLKETKQGSETETKAQKQAQ
jgi:hypothetical protein